MRLPSEHMAGPGFTVEFGSLRISYVVTTDDFDGMPVLPGFFTDDIFWGVVARLPGGRTRWRRIELLQQTSIGEAAP
jgi:hypothetical protein